MEVIKGRMYDYNNGRFLSVDPFIQSPTSTQSMNPYTYIFNNPLSGVDPTGYYSRGGNGWQSYGSVCVEGLGCTGKAGSKKETDSGKDGTGSNSNNDKDPSTIKDENGKVVGTDFVKVEKNLQDLRYRVSHMTVVEQLLFLIVPSTQMNEQQVNDKVNDLCGGQCRTDYSPEEIANFQEYIRQYNEYAERVLAWVSGGELTPGLTSKTASRTMTARVATKLTIDENKYLYIFGKVDSSSHNAARSNQLALTMKNLGIDNNASGHKLLSNHFNSSVQGNKNITKTFTNKHGNFEVRESLFFGPSGRSVKLQSTFEVLSDGTRSFNTVIPKGSASKF